MIWIARQGMERDRRHDSPAWPSVFDRASGDRKAADADFFALHTVAMLRSWSDAALREAGRLLFPMVYDGHRDRFNAVTWQEAFAVIGMALARLADPGHLLVRTSFDTSVDAASLLDRFRCEVADRRGPRDGDVRQPRLAHRRRPRPFQGFLLDFGNTARRIDRSMMLGGKLALAVHVGTDLHRGMLTPAEISVILPTLAPGEACPESGRKRYLQYPNDVAETATSRTAIPDYIPTRSEVAIVSEMAAQVFGRNAVCMLSHAGTVSPEISLAALTLTDQVSPNVAAIVQSRSLSQADIADG